MPTDKTRSVSGRVPVAVAEALEADATELGVKPGSLLRKILEGRYAVPRRVGKLGSPAQKPDTEIPVEDIDD